MDERKFRNVSERISIPVSECFECFLSTKRAENLSEATLEGYTIAGKKFLSTLPENITTDSLSIDQYNHFVGVLKSDTKKGDVTVQTYCRNTACFLHWAMAESYCAEFRVALPKANQTVKKVYSDSDLKKLLTKPEKGCSELEYMIWVIENVAIASGLRLRSIINLKVSDLQGNQLTVRETKTRRPVITTLNNDCVVILQRYIKLFGLAPNDYIFCKTDGEHYAADSIKKYIATYNSRRGVSITSIHCFRHFFAASLYRQTGDLLLVQHALGHASLNTTLRYLRTLCPSDFSEALLKSGYNPQKKYGQKSCKRRGKMK